MAKKTWIAVKVGLANDPKHERQMGKAIYLFLYMLDICDWETGTITGWVDANAASDRECHIQTVRKHRKALTESGYISARQGGPSGMKIVIHKYINPRSYSGKVLNSDIKSAPSDNANSDTNSDTNSIEDRLTPSIDSKIKEQYQGDDMKAAFDAIAEGSFNIHPGYTGVIPGGRITPISKWFYRQGVPAEDIPRFYEWWRRAYPNISAPASIQKLELRLIEFRQSGAKVDNPQASDALTDVHEPTPAERAARIAELQARTDVE